MTKEEIDNLRREVERRATRDCCTGDEEHAAELLKALDEREALLAALHDAARCLRFVHGHNTGAEQAARDAIAKAES